MIKISHRLTLLCVKYVPIVIAIVEILAVSLSVFDIKIPLLGALLGTSVLTLIPMYILSYTFKFCRYHRNIINYLALNKVIYIIDSIFVIPLTNMYIIDGFVLLAAVFTTITIYNYIKYGDRCNT